MTPHAKVGILAILVMTFFANSRFSLPDRTGLVTDLSKVNLTPFGKFVRHSDSPVALSSAPRFLVVAGQTRRHSLGPDNHAVALFANFPGNSLRELVRLVETVVVTARAAEIKAGGIFMTHAAPLTVRPHLIPHPHAQLIVGHHDAFVTLGGAPSLFIVTSEAWQYA